MSIKSQDSPKTDRRILRTRQLLRDALMALIVERGYDSITIQDITDRANVARTTFYLHFADKEELLFSSMRDVYEELFASHFIRDDTAPVLPIDDASDYLHVQEYADFYRIMIGEHGSAVFVTRVRQYLAQIMRDRFLLPLLAQGGTARIPVDVLANLMAGAHIGIIAWWLEADMPYSPQEMARMHEDALLRGMAWAIDYPIEKLRENPDN